MGIRAGYFQQAGVLMGHSAPFLTSVCEEEWEAFLELTGSAELSGESIAAALDR